MRKKSEMRKDLKPIRDERMEFYGTFVRYGSKIGYGRPVRTLLFKDVTRADTGQVVADHIWFTANKGFDACYSKMKEDVVVSFTARVSLYEKGYKGNYGSRKRHPISKDYKLSYPTKIKCM